MSNHDRRPTRSAHPERPDASLDLMLSLLPHCLAALQQEEREMAASDPTYKPLVIPDELTAAQIAAFTGVCEATIHRTIRSGILKMRRRATDL